MWQSQIISVLLLLGSLLSAQVVIASPIPKPKLQDLSMTELEQKLEDIDEELTQLARLRMRSGIGSLGFRSITHESPNHQEWVEIQLEKETPINEIILTPTIRRDTHKAFQAEGLPSIFRIIVGTGQDREGVTVAEYSSTDNNSPHIAPLIFQTHNIKASWIRIEAQALSKRSFDGKYIFQLSEVMVFSNERNVALHRPVTSSSIPDFSAIAWDKRFLVDGHTPYLMDASQGIQSISFLSKWISLPKLLLDFGKPTSLSGIQIHAIDQSHMVPQSRNVDFGIPDHLLITGSSSPDFSDPITLLDFKKTSIQDTGPIMTWNIPETTCRYIQISSINAPPNSFIGFAEVEFFSGSQNKALGREFHIDNPIYQKQSIRKLSSLTDGRNFYGNLLPIHKWLNELARRQQLESERPNIELALQEQYTKQKEDLTLMRWLAALLSAGAIIIVLVHRILKQRAITYTRRRIAANLHDELGANLYAIGLFGDLAKQEVNDSGKENQWNKLTQYVDEIRALTMHTGQTVRYCANMLEAEQIYSNLVEDIKKLAEQLRADLEHHISFKNEEMLQALSSRKRIGIFLFYKECITNIIRHSEASHVYTLIVADKKYITLSVFDNGKGTVAPPTSLKRRARLLKAKLSIENPISGGTQITLNIKI